MRSLLKVVAVVMAVVGLVVGSFGTGTAVAEDRIVTRAEAFVDRDGAREFDHRFEIHELDDPVVDPGNLAFAHAQRCTDCRAVALSFQIVLLQQPAQTVQPENLALSFNEECTGCDAAAGAYQFVVGRGEPIRLTPAGYRELGRVRGEVARLRGSHLTGPETVARADLLADEVRGILQREVKPVGEPVPVTIEDHRIRSSGQGPPEERTTTVATAA